MKTITIGRLPENDIVIDNGSVSRKHARITETETGVFEIEDLKSKNGTYVNGMKVSGKKRVSPKDKIVVWTIPVTNWYKKISEKDDNDNNNDNKVSEEVPSQKQPSEYDTGLNDSVLYDLKKDAKKMFSNCSERVSTLITEYKESHRFAKKKHTINQYSEDFFDILLEQYQLGCAQMVDFMRKVENVCTLFEEEYNADIKRLDNTYQYWLITKHSSGKILESLKEVEAKKDQYHMFYEQLRQQVSSQIVAIIEDFYNQNQPLYSNRYELAPADSSIWNELRKNPIDIQNTFYIGEDVFSFNILKDVIPFRIRMYTHTLCGGNLQLIYNRQYMASCYGIANTMISRMLMSVPNGGINIYMVDLHEKEGSSNAFKNLNKNTYRIISRHDELISLLNNVSIHIENVIQNLLKDDITSLSDYNKGKTNKEAYQLIVLKDVPIGYNSEVWVKLSEIMYNGPRAGVSVILLVNDDVVNGSEEMQKGYHHLQNAIKNSPHETLNLITQELPSQLSHTNHSLRFDILSSQHISDIVKRVNQDMEMKEETVLHYTDYMLPEKEWWTGQSANRIDLPFGMSSDMKITSLQITQESGQNSAVVIGIPGSGKSVFLHTIIVSAITHYSPKELQLYLLDFSGVEFNTYAQHKLPHARVIAPEAEREFGLSILRELKAEGDRRMALCRENDVTNIVELKEKKPNMVVPRLLVIIDEFQKLFEIDTDKISQEANRYIHIIIQEYRKFGINLILATQKLPSKGILPRDLIANRVVFKSDPTDFGELIKWPSQMPKPRLQTGVCIYNEESGSEYANNVTRGFFVKASTELNVILDSVTAFAKTRHMLIDEDLTLRVFRSNDLPDYADKRMLEKHYQLHDVPQEVGVYVGENIAVSDSDVFVPLHKESNNNILIVGGRQDVAKKIAYYTILSQSIAHNVDTATFAFCNFMRNDDESQILYNSEQIDAIKQTAKWIEARRSDEVMVMLQNLKELVDYRKSMEEESELEHVYLHVFPFQMGRMFDMVGSTGDRPSECSKLLEAILRDGPSLGVFTVLQVDNLSNLNKIGRGVLNLFNHRIALQMTENDSNKVVGTAAANKLKISGRPSSDYRALYYNVINNEITKFKPYK